MKNIKTKSEFINEAIHGMYPKSNLGVGKFLVAYYHGKDEPDAGSIYRISNEGHSSYSVFNISCHDKGQMGMSIDDSQIIGTEEFNRDANTSYCYEVVDIEFVKNLIEDVQLEDVINLLANRDVSIMGIDSDKHYEYYSSLKPFQLSDKYIKEMGGALKILVSIYDGAVNVYNPLMDFPGDFGGNKPVKFNQ